MEEVPPGGRDPLPGSVIDQAVLVRSVDEAENLARSAIEIAASTDALTPRAEVLLDAVEVALLADRAEVAVGRAKEAARLLEEKENVAALPRAWSVLELLTND